jgi:hypothetical protein
MVGRGSFGGVVARPDQCPAGRSGHRPGVPVRSTGSAAGGEHRAGEGAECVLHVVLEHVGHLRSRFSEHPACRRPLSVRLHLGYRPDYSAGVLPTRARRLPAYAGALLATVTVLAVGLTACGATGGRTGGSLVLVDQADGNSSHCFAKLDHYVFERMALLISKRHGRSGRGNGMKHIIMSGNRLGLESLAGNVVYGRTAHAPGEGRR